jgi:hypothetical protein
LAPLRQLNSYNLDFVAYPAPFVKQVMSKEQGQTSALWQLPSELKEHVIKQSQEMSWKFDIEFSTLCLVDGLDINLGFNMKLDSLRHSFGITFACYAITKSDVVISSM